LQPIIKKKRLDFRGAVCVWVIIFYNNIFYREYNNL